MDESVPCLSPGIGEGVGKPVLGRLGGVPSSGWLVASRKWPREVGGRLSPDSPASGNNPFGSCLVELACCIRFGDCP